MWEVPSHPFLLGENLCNFNYSSVFFGYSPKGMSLDSTMTVCLLPVSLWVLFHSFSCRSFLLDSGLSH